MHVPLPARSLQSSSHGYRQQTPARVGGVRRGGKMLWTICVILIVLWLLGMVSSYTMGGFIHVLLVIAIVVILINVISGRR
jgi:Family of unknown function (DUF5670)